MTNEKPYFPNVITQPQEDDLKEKTKVFENSSGHNLLREDTDWAGLDLQLRMTYFLRRKKQKLCAGILQRNPALDKNLKCIWLNHGNPYLKLGPWNYEWLHQN